MKGWQRRGNDFDWEMELPNGTVLEVLREYNDIKLIVFGAYVNKKPVGQSNSHLGAMFVAEDFAGGLGAP